MERHLQIRPGFSLTSSDLHFRFSRSGGPGGQNVNKVETRVEVGIPVASSRVLPQTVRERLVARLGGRLDEDGWLRVAADESRSQFRNREIAIERLTTILREALRPLKSRKPTRPTGASRLEKAREKKLQSEKKRRRSSSRFLEEG
jgi:ribosome-associated protein